MTTSAWGVYTQTEYQTLLGNVNWQATTIKCALLSNGYTPAQDTDALWSGISANEVTGTGYTAGGVTVTSPTVSVSGSAVTATGTVPPWTSSTIGARYAVLYDSATGKLLAFSDLTGSTTLLSSVNGTLSVSGYTVTGSHTRKMAWTSQQLAEGVAALPSGLSDADAASALAAETTTLTEQTFTVHDAKLIAQMSTNFSWAKILQRSEATAAIPPATAVDAAILAARTITSLSSDQIVDPTSPTAWAAWQAGVAALSSVGDLSFADVAAISALPTRTTLTWQPSPTEFDVAAARGA